MSREYPLENLWKKVQSVQTISNQETRMTRLQELDHELYWKSFFIIHNGLVKDGFKELSRLLKVAYDAGVRLNYDRLEYFIGMTKESAMYYYGQSKQCDGRCGGCCELTSCKNRPSLCIRHRNKVDECDECNDWEFRKCCGLPRLFCFCNL